MTAIQAVKKECQKCMNNKRFPSCISTMCVLNKRKDYKSTLRMIKAHCLTCIPEGSIFAVKLCDTPNCNLWSYRLGKNPNRKKRQFSDKQRAEIRARFVKKPHTEVVL